MKFIPMIIICLFLTACSSNPIIADKANINPKIYMECEDLPKLKSGSDTDNLQWSKQVIELYHECKIWKSEENKLVKKAFGIK